MAEQTTTCAHCGVAITDPTSQVVHGDRTFCCANCAALVEQTTGGSDPHGPVHENAIRCAHCSAPIIHDLTMEMRGDDAFCCRNCATAGAATR